MTAATVPTPPDGGIPAGSYPAGLDPAWHPYPAPVAGETRILVRRQVLSPELRNFRDLLVALPASYESTGTRYPVVYMHDGQNLFDPATSHAGDWRLGPALGDLATRGIEAIVVGIPNMGRRRIYEYGPFRDARVGGGGGDRYLRFLAETVKPLIDRSFRTDPAPEATAIAGSSMGGLISLYGLFHRGECFGAAAAMSPSVWFADRAILDDVTRWAPSRRGRLYLDIGLDEGDAAVADVRTLRDVLLAAGLREGVDLDYVEAEGGVHHEEDWGRRIRRAIPFLLCR